MLLITKKKLNNQLKNSFQHTSFLGWNCYFDTHHFKVVCSVVNGETFLINNSVTQLILEDGMRVDISNLNYDNLGHVLGINGSGLFARMNNEFIQIFTDIMATMPIYYSEEKGVITTHLHLLNLIDSPEIDTVTLAEFLKFGQSAFPYTVFKGIKELKNFSTITIEKQLFRITHNNEFEFANVALNSSLEDVISQSLERQRLNSLGIKNYLLLSAGVDSRAVLYSNIDSLTALTISDNEKKMEVVLARQLAKNAGRDWKFLQRKEYAYYTSLSENLDCLPNLCNIDSNHYSVLDDYIEKNSTVYSGCFADYLLKGATYNTQSRYTMGFWTPLKKLAPFDLFYYHDNLDSGYFKGIEFDRYLASHWDSFNYFKEIHSDIDDCHSLVRTTRMGREPDSYGRHFLRNNYDWRPYFVDVDLFFFAYKRMNKIEKIDQKIYRKSIANLCNSCGNIPDANNGAKLDSSENEIILSFFMRKIYIRLKFWQNFTSPWENHSKSLFLYYRNLKFWWYYGMNKDFSKYLNYPKWTYSLHKKVMIPFIRLISIRAYFNQIPNEQDR